MCGYLTSHNRYAILAFGQFLTEGVKMAGYNEEADDRAVAEEMKTVVLPLFPDRRISVLYLGRESVMEYDEHRIIARKPWLAWLPFNGEIIARYFGRRSALCHVHHRGAETSLQERFPKITFKVMDG